MIAATASTAAVSQTPLVSSWAQVVPWLLVAVGWIIVNIQNNSRESRKEIRAKIDAVKKSLDEVEDLSVQHHTVSQDLLRCMRIKRVFVSVGREIRMISGAGLDINDAAHSLTRFRQAVTIKNFESNDYKTITLGDEIVADIGATSDNVRSKLELAYSEKFQKSIFKKIFKI